MTGSSTRHTALAVCFAVLLLVPVPMVFAATPADAQAVWPDPYYQRGAFDTDARLWSSDRTVQFKVANHDGAPGLVGMDVLCADGSENVTQVTLSAFSWEGPHDPCATGTTIVGYALYTPNQDGAEDPDYDARTYYACAGDHLCEEHGDGFTSVTCPDQDELFDQVWANWTGTYLTVLAQPNEDAWTTLTSQQPDHLKPYPAPGDWQVTIGTGATPLLADLPAGFASLGAPPVRTNVGPGGAWTGLDGYYWTTDPAALADLADDGTPDDRVVILWTRAEPDAEGLVNPPCMAVIPLDDLPEQDGRIPQPPPSYHDHDDDPDTPDVVTDPETEPDCGIFRLLDCLKWLLIPSEDSLTSIQDTMQIVDVVPFSYAIDFGTWVGDMTDVGYENTLPPEVAFNFSPITGNATDRVVLLSEDGHTDGGAPCGTAVVGSCDEPTGASRILRGMRPWISFIVWGATGLAFFRVVSRGGFSLGADKAA